MMQLCIFYTVLPSLKRRLLGQKLVENVLCNENIMFFAFVSYIIYLLRFQVVIKFADLGYAVFPFSNGAPVSRDFTGEILHMFFKHNVLKINH